jgi:uncharacterized protein with von Willebrand factor type A (vWA) domain
MNAATFFFGGSTDYESPLSEALRLIDNGGPEWRKANIVFLTDDYPVPSLLIRLSLSSAKKWADVPELVEG